MDSGRSRRPPTPNLRPAGLAGPYGATAAVIGAALHLTEWSRAATVPAGMAPAITEAVVPSWICISPSCVGRLTADIRGRRATEAVRAAFPATAVHAAAAVVVTTARRAAAEVATTVRRAVADTRVVAEVVMSAAAVAAGTRVAAAVTKARGVAS